MLKRNDDIPSFQKLETSHVDFSLVISISGKLLYAFFYFNPNKPSFEKCIQFEKDVMFIVSRV